MGAAPIWAAGHSAAGHLSLSSSYRYVTRKPSSSQRSNISPLYRRFLKAPYLTIVFISTGRYHISNSTCRLPSKDEPFTPLLRLYHLTPSELTASVTMASSDLDQLIEMGFDKERSEIAVKKGNGSMLLSSPATVCRPLTVFCNALQFKVLSNGWKQTRISHWRKLKKRRARRALHFSRERKLAAWCATSVARSSGAMHRPSFTRLNPNTLTSPNRPKSLLL